MVDVLNIIINVVHGGCIMKATLIVVNLYYFIIEHISLLVKITY